MLGVLALVVVVVVAAVDLAHVALDQPVLEHVHVDPAVVVLGQEVEELLLHLAGENVFQFRVVLVLVLVLVHVLVLVDVDVDVDVDVAATELALDLVEVALRQAKSVEHSLARSTRLCATRWRLTDRNLAQTTRSSRR